MLIEIPVGKSRYKITCEESEKEKLLNIAERLNQRVNALSLQIKNIDEKTLLVIAALMIEEELSEENKVETPEDDEDESVTIVDRDVYDAVSESMNNIADYIENLTKKIQNY